MKKAIALIMLILCFCLSGCFNIFIPPATEGYCGDSITWSFEDGVLTFHGSGDMDSFYLDGERGVRQLWQRLRNKIKEVKMDDGITSIGDGTFYLCKNLEKITLSKTTERIEALAFYRCRALTEIRLPNGLCKIGSSAFSDCSSLQSILMPETITGIGEDAFEDVPQEVLNTYNGIQYAASERNPYYAAVGILESKETLKHAEISDQTRVICDGLLSSAYQVESVSIGSNVTHIGYGLCYYLKYINEITVDDDNESFCADGRVMFCLDIDNKTASIIAYAWDSGETYDFPSSVIHKGSTYMVTTIPYMVFNGVDQLKAVTIPNTITTMEDGAFTFCDSLKRIVIPGSIESIPYDAFRGCDALEYVEIEDGVKTIGPGAFRECSGLNKVYLPKSISRIETNAFCTPDGTITLDYAGTQEQWDAIEIETAPFYEWRSSEFITPEYDVRYLSVPQK